MFEETRFNRRRLEGYTLAHFALRVRFDEECPWTVSEERWSAMLTQFKNVIDAGQYDFVTGWAIE